jgi:hypothetical protein
MPTLKAREERLTAVACVADVMASLTEFMKQKPIYSQM